MTDYERAVLISILVDIKAQTVVEIGCNEGYCAFDVLSHLPAKSYIGIDLDTVTAKVIKSHPDFTLLTRKRGTLDLTPDDLPMVDAVIIDGDHHYDLVKHDTELATAITRRGGIIIWHDYAFWDGCDVPRLLHELAPTRAIKHIENTGLAIEYR